MQSLYILSHHLPDRPTSKNRQKKTPVFKFTALGELNLNGIRVVIWCILAPSLKAFLQVFGRKGCRIFGAAHKRQQKLPYGRANSLKLKQSAEGQKKLIQARLPIKLQTVFKTFQFVLRYNMNLKCVTWLLRLCGSLCAQLVMGKTKKNRKYQEPVAHSDSWSLYQCHSQEHAVHILNRKFKNNWHCLKKVV